MAERQSALSNSSTDLAASRTLPFPTELHPAAAELLLRGRATHAGIAAVLVRLGLAGWLHFSELEGGGWALRLKTSARGNEECLPESERAVLSGLRRWAEGGTVPPFGEFRAALRCQTVADGTLSEADWSALERWHFLPTLARRALPAVKRRAALALAAELSGYPAFNGPLPQSRQDWDDALAYALATGQGRAFLGRAREVCDYYHRHLEGIVMTFYTPTWYTALPAEGQDRFAFLTAGVAPLLAGLSWGRVRSVR